MTRAIRTYSMADRAVSPDFAIRDEKSVTRITEAHRHEYFQIQLNLAGRTMQHIAAAERPPKRQRYRPVDDSMRLAARLKLRSSAAMMKYSSARNLSIADLRAVARVGPTRQDDGMTY